jgi:hypothetical protein
VQRFHVFEQGARPPRTYHSTTKAWERDEFKALLQEAGFRLHTEHPEWDGGEHFMLLSAMKSNS